MNWWRWWPKSINRPQHEFYNQSQCMLWMLLCICAVMQVYEQINVALWQCDFNFKLMLIFLATCQQMDIYTSMGSVSVRCLFSRNFCCQLLSKIWLFSNKIFHFLHQLAANFLAFSLAFWAEAHRAGFQKHVCWKHLPVKSEHQCTWEQR